MRKRSIWISISIGLLVAIEIAVIPQIAGSVTPSGTNGPIVAQAPIRSPTPPAAAPTLPPAPAIPGAPTSVPTVPTFPPGTPSPLPATPGTTPPATSPNALPVPPAPPPAPPVSTAPPLPLAPGNAGMYFDPAGRFRIGVLQGYKVSPLAGTVLIESPDGSLAYSVVVQSQPLDNPIGLVPSFLTTDALAQVAGTVFQRGEDFQPGTAQPEAGGGAVINWTGNLTIAGKSQPVGGVILVRPSPKNILLLVISATETGSNQVPGALSALATTLQAA